VTDDLRQRYAEEMSRHHLVDGVTDADDNTLCVCGQWADAEDESWDDHMAEVCAAVRDEEMAALHQQLARAEIAFDDLHVEAIDLGQRAEQAEAILRELIDPSPCDHFDHHGQCQTHGRWDDQGRCLDARGRELLVALDEPEAARD
jgi:hypothetical protein